MPRLSNCRQPRVIQISDIPFRDKARLPRGSPDFLNHTSAAKQSVQRWEQTTSAPHREGEQSLRVLRIAAETVVCLTALTERHDTCPDGRVNPSTQSRTFPLTLPRGFIIPSQRPLNCAPHQENSSNCVPSLLLKAGTPRGCRGEVSARATE
jgi:hypothetical protein